MSTECDCPKCECGFIVVLDVDEDTPDEDNCPCLCHHDEHSPDLAEPWQECDVCAIKDHGERESAGALRIAMWGAGVSLPARTDREEDR